MPGPKFRHGERQIVMERVAFLYRNGYTQVEIAKDVGLSQVTISDYLKQMREITKDRTRELMEEVQKDKQRAIARVLDQVTDVTRLSLSEYERSRQDAQERVVESVPEKTCGRCAGTGFEPEPTAQKNKFIPRSEGDPCIKCSGKGLTGGIVRETLTTTGRLGDPKYLQLMLDGTDKAAKLLDLYPQKAKTEVNVGDQWNVLVTMGAPRHTVEDKITAMVEDRTNGTPASEAQAGSAGGG